MKIPKSVSFTAILLFGLAAWAQEFPKAEVGADYTYARIAPNFSGSQGHSLNGGGGWAVLNLKSYLGIKMDLQGYGSTTSSFVLPPSTSFPSGGSANVQGNMFTYLFGPQIKIRTPKFQPFFQLLLGGAHSNVYGNAYKDVCLPTAGACSFSKAPSGNAFALAFGGGIDIPVGKTISIRPAEIDYLLTDFTNRFNNSNQNNFRYSAGINFSFGGR